MNPSEINQAGKGDMPRPISLSKYQKNYELYFGKNKKQKETSDLGIHQMPILIDPDENTKIPGSGI